MTDVAGRMRQLQVIPVIVIDDAADAVPLVDALAGGGLPCAEITFRTAAAGDALRRIADERPAVLAGAGTVLSTATAQQARAAGARFMVAPGLNPAVVGYCLEHGIPVFPGVCTPTEIEAALELGLTTLKFFPAEAIGGIRYLKAIAAPYGNVDFIPTGGITAANVADYLSFPRVLACGGSWMAPADWIGAKQFERIGEETARAAGVARAARGGS
jgi:2-dehydro-3-deoxyphosphogluconate aldolase/(4S)-4-hydroxy-2-oxoglutarate aldolase